MKGHYPLKSKDVLSELARSKGIDSWGQLTQWIRKLPYGRNKNRSDLALVLFEEKGSCSSKHALLKKLADLNGIPNVKLILGIYKMSSLNTPSIGTALTKNGLNFIPEAHCYLKIDQSRFDYTSPSSSFNRIEMDILQETEIEPDQVAVFKVNFHKAFLKKWIIETKLGFDFDELWEIRENCIRNLAKQLPAN